MRPRIKVSLIPEIFLHCVETKEYCEQNETLENFLNKTSFLENFWLMRAERVAQRVAECMASFLFRDKDLIDGSVLSYCENCGYSL